MELLEHYCLKILIRLLVSDLLFFLTVSLIAQNASLPL